MAKSYLPYELSLEADKDLENIFDYTAGKFGFDQAIIYVGSFDEVFENLSGHPELGRKRNEIRAGLRSFVKESHVIFYRIMATHIRIVRVLHVSRDITSFFPPAD